MGTSTPAGYFRAYDTITKVFAFLDLFSLGGGGDNGGMGNQIGLWKITVTL